MINSHFIRINLSIVDCRNTRIEAGRLARKHSNTGGGKKY